ncbi:hypothetical protein Nepgr_029413 [Nepenthes gracilis]|uniref:Protein SPIRAL1-like 1 n=1 Tax=Nepenthes gracilis TaxID=150966 RepID=A0AAD3Y4U0_NEPGR|nr:hypothetical protein Nepgr_029413 [Nepenthes gracilis]
MQAQFFALTGSLIFKMKRRKYEYAMSISVIKTMLYYSFTSSLQYIFRAVQSLSLGMGRGVSSGGGQSSLGYLFGSGEAPKPTANTAPATPNEGQVVKDGPSAIPVINPQTVDVSKQIPAGIHSNNANNYIRMDGQNSGNFITDRPSTKVHAAPGGDSSLGYLFGSSGTSN